MIRLRSSPTRYGVAIVATALATLLYFASGPVELDSDIHYFGFVLAVLVAALTGGIGPGLLATCLSALASMYLLLPPIYSFQVSSQDQVQRLILFGGEGVLLSCVGHIFHDADASDNAVTWPWRYLPVLLFVSTATGLKLLAFKDVERALPFTFFYVAVAASAWTGGFGPGLAATVLSALTAAWLFFVPQSSRALLEPINAARIVFFLLEGGMITGVAATYPRARRLTARAIEQMRQHTERMHRGLESMRALRLTSTDLIWEWDPVLSRITVGATEAERPETATVSMSFATWLEQIHPEDRAVVAASLNLFLKQGRDDWAFEYRKLRPGREPVCVADRAYVIRDADGRPMRVIGRTVDVTESKYLARMYGAQRQLRVVFEQSPLAILITDDALHVTGANRAAGEILRSSNSDLMDMHIEKLFQVSRREQILQMLLGLSHEGHASVAFQETCARVGGELFQGKINAAVLDDIDHGLKGWVIMIEEVDK